MNQLLNQNLECPVQIDFFLIGAQKCATSWMYFCLRDHPDICLPSKKMEAAYIGGDLYQNKGTDWFFSRFNRNLEKVCGDVSVEYLYDATTPAAIAEIAPSPKIVAVLRNPVDRMVSSYYWLVRRGQLKNLPPEQGLAALLNEKPGFTTPIDGPLEEVVRRSCYGPQINRFIDTFGPESMMILLYEDIASDGLFSIQSVYQFLGVDDRFRPPSLEAAPKRNAYVPWLLSIENRYSNSKAIAKLTNYANQALLYLKAQKRGEIISQDFRAKLDELFLPAIQETVISLERIPRAQRPDITRLQQVWAQ